MSNSNRRVSSVVGEYEGALILHAALVWALLHGVCWKRVLLHHHVCAMYDDYHAPESEF